jgi:glycosyltransferase involved in cell wall biosynthesis
MGSQAGAAFSNPSASELARDSENTSRNRSAIGPASALRAINRGMGSAGGDQLADSKGGLGDQSQAGLQMDSQKLQNIRKANALNTSGQSSSSVLISDISGRKNSGTLDSGRWSLDSAPQARVLNLDDLTEREKQDALAACDVLCVPSEGESFGMVYYEAWAYKKPVVALDLPVLRESIGRVEGGLLTFSEPDSIGGALVRLLDDKGLRKEMGIRGFDLAKVHSWDKSLESYSLVYQGVGASI